MLQLIKYHPLFAYSVGDRFKVNAEDENLLIEGGYAVRVSEELTEEELEAQIKAEEEAKRVAAEEAAKKAATEANTKDPGKK